ncbi:hypothetical protein ACWGOE_07290 [Leucobacter chromiiresistens]
MSEIKVTFSNGVKCSVSTELAERLGPTFKAAGARGRTTQRAAAKKSARSTSTTKTGGKGKATAAPATAAAEAPVPAGGAPSPADLSVADVERPSAEWTAEQLSEFAAEHDIELGGATKQPEILAAIDAFLSEDDDEDDESDDENE